VRKGIFDGAVEDRARVLLEAWLRGQNQGGHTPSPQDIGEVYVTCLHNALWELTRCPLTDHDGPGPNNVIVKAGVITTEAHAERGVGNE